MNYIKLFENYKNSSLLIIDVQKSFKDFFTEQYVIELKKYAKSFSNVYQVWDNHVDGKDVDLDYLYDSEPDIPMHSDLYRFPNEIEIIEKRYNYDVDIDFYKSIISNEDYKRISDMVNGNTIKPGDYVQTNKGTIIVYIGNKHIYFHCPKKLYDILSTVKENQMNGAAEDLIVVGGSDSECLEDVVICAKAMGVRITRNNQYIYTATNCPI